MRNIDLLEDHLLAFPGPNTPHKRFFGRSPAEQNIAVLDDTAVKGDWPGSFPHIANDNSTEA